MTGDMPRIGQETKRAVTRLADAIWPQRSLVSGEPARGALSPEDFAALSFITGAVCQMCGVPQELDLGIDTLCPACMARPRAWSRARAALTYDDVSRRPLLDLKRAGRRDGLKVMATWMALAGADLLAETDVIVPVPLHYFRLASRGYNQSGWLARAVADRAGLPVRLAALMRHRATPSQAGLSPRARKRNVRGAFRVRRSHIGTIRDKRVLLIDDVLTTGATLEASARALRAAGARDVMALVLARVVRDTDITL